MLFSREDVSSYIQQNFEPAWEMVRPVPIVRIDFGNGRTATRTLHGNVASYACTPDGRIADILPGIYQPGPYLTALRDPRDFAVELNRLNGDERLVRFRAYHRTKMQNLRNRQAPVPPRITIPEIDRGKGRIERPLDQNLALMQAALQQQQAAIQQQAPSRRPRTASELASWQPLAEDTQLNELQRRLQIHERFAGAESVRPEQIKVWLYREVLHADLEDPFMGLGDDFFDGIEQ